MFIVLTTYGSLIVSIVSYNPITTCILRSTMLSIDIKSKGGGGHEYYAHSNNLFKFCVTTLLIRLT